MTTLCELTDCCRSSVQRWISGKNAAPWQQIEKIAGAVVLAPELLATTPTPKTFDRGKFDHYLRQRGVSLDRLVNAGRFGSYSFSTIAKWRGGTFAPSQKAIRVLEHGLSIKVDALTDGPLEDVPAFSAGEIEQWSQMPENPFIRHVLRSWIKEQQLSWNRFSKMVPGYSPMTVVSWLRGREEPSNHGIMVLQGVTGLPAATLVKRRKTRRPPVSLVRDPPKRAMSIRTGGVRLAHDVAGAAQVQPVAGQVDSRRHNLLATGIAADQPRSVLFDELSQYLHMPQQWREGFDYLIPRLLVRLAVWPQGRGLQIDSLEGKPLFSWSGMDRAPVRVFRQGGEYYGFDSGQLVPGGSDGDGFFRALLISMGQAQTVLARNLSLGPDRSEQAFICSLRSHLGQYVLENQTQVGQLLYPLSVEAPPPQ